MCVSISASVLGIVICCKVNKISKFVPVLKEEPRYGAYWGVEIQPHILSASALDEGQW